MPSPYPPPLLRNSFRRGIYRGTYLMRHIHSTLQAAIYFTQKNKEKKRRKGGKMEEKEEEEEEEGDDDDEEEEEEEHLFPQANNPLELSS